MHTQPLKEVVYNHLSTGGSLRELVESHPNDDEKKFMSTYGNILKNSYSTTADHFRHCYEEVKRVQGTLHLPNIREYIRHHFPHAEQAINALFNNSQPDFDKAVWESVRPWGITSF